MRSKWIKRLEKVECPDTTCITPTFPTVLKKGKGVYVTDVNDKKYLDFTSGFGTIALGHRSPTTLNALKKQSAKLIQGLGDLHPNEPKIKLLELIAEVSPYDNAKSLLGMSGGDAIEIAMKTAVLATNRSKFISFEGGYHGVQLAPLNLNHNETFTEGFEGILKNKAAFLPFPHFPENGPLLRDEAEKTPHDVLTMLEALLKTEQYAALIMEPIQGRAGTRIFGSEFIKECQNLCKKYGSLLVFDEIMTGFGRTGKMFAYEHSNVVPDLMCIGKAMGGGMPVSACVGNVMDAWKKSQGEAKHTQTYLGHPLSCAVAYETILTIRRQLPKFTNEFNRIERLLQKYAKKWENNFPCHIRGKGVMNGLYFYTQNQGFGIKLMEALYEKLILTLPEGKNGEILALIPSFPITAKHYQILLIAVENQLSKLL